MACDSAIARFAHSRAAMILEVRIDLYDPHPTKLADLIIAYPHVLTIQHICQIEALPIDGRIEIDDGFCSLHIRRIL